VFSRGLRIAAFVFIGGVLLVACLFAFAIYSFWCPVSVTATREHMPTILAPPETSGQSSRRLTLPQPRLRVEELENDRLIYTTALSVADVFDFYKHQLVAEGWDSQIAVNQQTSQMFIVNKQACPFIALEIRTQSLSQTETQVIIDPYWPDSPECGDCN
jgi:hypothetical protein